MGINVHPPQTNLIPELQKVPEMKFYVYGFNKDEDHGNVQLRSFSEVVPPLLLPMLHTACVVSFFAIGTALPQTGSVGKWGMY